VSWERLRPNQHTSASDAQNWTRKKKKEKIGQHFRLADERAEHRRTNKSAGRSEPGELLAAKRNARAEYCRWQEQRGLRLREKKKKTKLIARFSQEQIRLQTMN
jgi:hypothetical protein